MTIGDIIRNDADRVFAIDPECFIIFTGDSTSDKKPFIRVGNWIGLPADIIPLVENIIITDTMTGNPAHEQFSIDITSLSTNRYIGSRTAVEKYMDYQQVFGLDLHNAAVVDAEHDIPDISKSSVSDKEAFLGIFYRNGNFKVLHHGRELFDLSQLNEIFTGDNRAHDSLAALAKPKRYTGAGFVIIENNPVFYNAGSFATYLFPHSYLDVFSNLEINPRSIAAVIHPSQNYLGISRYLKWRSQSGGKISLYTDSTEESGLLSKLFSGVKIAFDSFTGCKVHDVKGLTVSQISKSYNIAVDIEKTAERLPLSIAYIKSEGEINKVAKGRFNLILINFSVYQDTAFALRSCGAPIVVIDDGSPKISRIPTYETPVIYPNLQYELSTAPSEADLLSYATSFCDGDLPEHAVAKDYDYIDKVIQGEIDQYTKSSIQYFNALSYLHVLGNTTNDRKTAGLIKNHLRDAYATNARRDIYRMSRNVTIELLLSGSDVYEFARVNPLDESVPLDTDFVHSGAPLSNTEKVHPSRASVLNRIEEDRIRLGKLLSLYLHNSAFRAETENLKTLINERKHIFDNESRNFPSKDTRFIDFLRSTVSPSSVSSSASSRKKTRLRRNKNSVLSAFTPKRIVLIACTIIFIAAGIVLFTKYPKWKSEQTAKQNAALEIKQQEETKRITAAYSVKVDELDIFRYANEIAVKNGYSSIPLKSLNKKNPNWIYPGNILTLPDGEKLTIQPGDSIWKIARDKIMRRYTEFFKAYDLLKKKAAGGKAIQSDEIQDLRSLASTSDQRLLADSLAKAEENSRQ